MWNREHVLSGRGLARRPLSARRVHVKWPHTLRSVYIISRTAQTDMCADFKSELRGTENISVLAILNARVPRTCSENMLPGSCTENIWTGPLSHKKWACKGDSTGGTVSLKFSDKFRRERLRWFGYTCTKEGYMGYIGKKCWDGTAWWEKEREAEEDYGCCDEGGCGGGWDEMRMWKMGKWSWYDPLWRPLTDSAGGWRRSRPLLPGLYYCNIILALRMNFDTEVVCTVLSDFGVFLKLLNIFGM